MLHGLADSRRHPISCPELPVDDENMTSNTERIIRDTKRELRLLKTSLCRNHSSDQPRSAIKSQQRSLRQLLNIALQQQIARVHARRDRQRHATSKWQHARSRGTGKDVPIPSRPGSVDKLAVEFLADYSPFDPYVHRCAFLVNDDEDCGACIQPGRGWRVVAIYVAHDKLCDSHYLAVNPATSQAILSPFEIPSDNVVIAYDDNDEIYTFWVGPCIGLVCLVQEGLDAALRTALSPRGCNPAIVGALSLSCTDMMRYARSRLDPVNPKQPLQQQASRIDQMQSCRCEYWACHACMNASRKDAVSALYATFL